MFSQAASWKRPEMALESLFVILVVGAVTGWLAGLIVKGYGYGLHGNIVIGILGAFVAGFVFRAWAWPSELGSPEP